MHSILHSNNRDVTTDFIRTVKDRCDLVELISETVELKRSGSGLQGLCPFHADKTPSLSVSPDRGLWNCFVCGGGDVISWVEKRDGVEFRGAVETLARRGGIELPNMTPEQRAAMEQARTRADIVTETARFYHSTLTPETRARIGEERGWSDETIDRRLIGEARGGLRKRLAGKGFAEEDCIATAVLKRGEDGRVRDYFWGGRIIFPNITHGRVNWMTGRSPDGSEPKYLHTPGTKPLFNEDALRSTHVVVTEGPADVISLDQGGIPAVAVLGNSVKPEDVSRFERCERIFVALDADQGGDGRNLQIAGMLGTRARIVTLPDGMDPCDFMRDHAPAELQALLDAAPDAISYRVTQIPPDIPRLELRTALEPLLQSLAAMDPAQADAYLTGTLKPHFKLTREELTAYRRTLKLMRKQAETAENEERKQSQPSYRAIFDGLVDVVEHEGTTAFLIRNGDGPEILSQAELDDGTVLPPPAEQLPKPLARSEAVLELHALESQLSPQEADAALYDDLRTYFAQASELPREPYYDLMVVWTLHTYLLNAFEYSPILCFFGVPERGKSRTGKALTYLAYRGLHVECLRDAYLCRFAHHVGGSVFFDLKSAWTKAEKAGSEDLLLGRFERGMTIPRVLYPDRGPFLDTVWYSIFGPTIIATNEPVHHILGSRCLPINMRESNRDFPNDVTMETARPLKERLVSFRLRHLTTELSQADKPARGRLGDIARPLVQVVRLVRPDREPVLLDLITSIGKERTQERAETHEGRLLSTILELAEGKNEDGNPYLSHGRLCVSDIADHLNEDTPERFRVSPRRIGTLLKSLGLRTGRTRQNRAALEWDAETVRRAAITHGVIEEQTGS
ncbi:MAG: CHC2 zinc finger domain-containing protein [Thermodesulfobacteriota bacterium]